MADAPYTFSPLQIGYITDTLKPIPADTYVKTALDIFAEKAGREAVPVEQDGAVLGVISRKIGESFANSAVVRAYQQNLRDFLIPFRGTLEASSYTAPLVDANLKIDQGEYPAWFMVRRQKQFLGIVSLQHMLEHTNMLRSQDLHTAGEIQRYLLKKSAVKDKRLEVFFYNQMAHEIGGDYHHILKGGDNQYLISCFDVAGKNLAGSMATMALGACFSTLGIFHYRESAEKTTSLLNTLVKEINPPGLFVAAIFFYVDFSAGTITIHNCGFSPVSVFIPREEKKISFKVLKPEFPPLGIEETLDTGAGHSIPITPGLRLCAYSDGMTDMTNIRGERYGDEKIMAFLKSMHPLQQGEMKTRISDEIRNWIGEASLADDATLVDIRFL